MIGSNWAAKIGAVSRKWWTDAEIKQSFLNNTLVVVMAAAGSAITTHIQYALDATYTHTLTNQLVHYMS